MASYTEHLDLLKKDPVADASDTFNIQTMMNDNWDKIDTAVNTAQQTADGKAASVHAAQHASGGSDPVTPASIGAAPAVHAHDDRYFTETESLDAATAALFGLGAAAVPKDVLAFLGQYSQHWWKRRSVTRAWSEVQAGSDTGVTISTGVTIYYADSISIDFYGNISLVSPSTIVYDGVDSTTVYATLLNKYFYYEGISAVYWVRASGGSSSSGYISVSYCRLIASSLTSETLGEWEDIQSTNETEYPEIGIFSETATEGYEYKYYRVPFTNAVTAPEIVSFSYLGTDTYGIGNPNSITLDKPPKMIFILGYKDGAYFTPHMGEDYYVTSVITDALSSDSYTRGLGLGYYHPTSYYIYGKKSSDGKTVYWYNNSNSSYQFNKSGCTYYGLAIM